MVSELLTHDVMIIKDVKCNETLWLKIKIRNIVDLYVGDVCTLTQGNMKQVCTDKFHLLEENICMFSVKRESLLLGDFNAGVGKSIDILNILNVTGLEKLALTSNSRLVSVT